MVTVLPQKARPYLEQPTADLYREDQCCEQDEGLGPDAKRTVAKPDQEIRHRTNGSIR